MLCLLNPGINAGVKDPLQISPGNQVYTQTPALMPGFAGYKSLMGFSPIFFVPA
jgi:hypothetical protein